MATHSPIVVFTGGFSMPVAVWRHALDLERRGIGLEVDEHGRLLATPQGLLTPGDIVRLRNQPDEYRSLCRYVVNQRWLAPEVCSTDRTRIRRPVAVDPRLNRAG